MATVKATVLRVPIRKRVIAMTTASLRFGANPPAVESGKPSDVVAGNPVT